MHADDNKGEYREHTTGNARVSLLFLLSFSSSLSFFFFSLFHIIGFYFCSQEKP